jgi:head-tail adaptor
MKYRHRLDVYRLKQPASDFEPVSETEEFISTIFGSIGPASGSESSQGDRANGRQAVTITTRWGDMLAEATSAWWAVYEGRRFNFLSVRNLDERRREVAIDAVEVT